MVVAEMHLHLLFVAAPHICFAGVLPSRASGPKHLSFPGEASPLRSVEADSKGKLPGRIGYTLAKLEVITRPIISSTLWLTIQECGLFFFYCYHQLFVG